MHEYVYSTVCIYAGILVYVFTVACVVLVQGVQPRCADKGSNNFCSNILRSVMSQHHGMYTEILKVQQKFYF